MIIRRRLPNGIGAPFTRRLIALSADAPLFRTRLPQLPGDPYQRRLVGYFVASDHPASEGPTGGGIPPLHQYAVTVISG